MLWSGVAFAACALAVLSGSYVHRRRAAARPLARLSRASQRMLSDVLLPHTESVHIHVGHLLLAPTGIMVVDLRDVAGHIFGSEAMQEWTVLDRSRRSTFPNPLPRLYDRIAAVRRIVPDLPVKGLVVFTDRAVFSKGFPPYVRLLDDLLRELEAGATAGDGVAVGVLDAAWTALAAETQPAVD